VVVRPVCETAAHLTPASNEFLTHFELRDDALEMEGTVNAAIPIRSFGDAARRFQQYFSRRCEAGKCALRKEAKIRSGEAKISAEMRRGEVVIGWVSVAET
jgi:hypothetical protein